MNCNHCVLAKSGKKIKIKILKLVTDLYQVRQPANPSPHPLSSSPSPSPLEMYESNSSPVRYRRVSKPASPNLSLTCMSSTFQRVKNKWFNLNSLNSIILFHNYPRRLYRSAWVGFSSPSVCLCVCLSAD